MKTTVRQMILPARNPATYLWAAVFVLGNVLFPRLCHLSGLGGPALLPIMLFTLVAALRYGIVCGITTAVVSPVLNHFLFGMPAGDILGILLVKSVILAFAVGWIAQRKSLGLLQAFAAIALSQIVGTGFAWIITGSFLIAWAQVTTALPGIALQLITIILFNEYNRRFAGS